MKTKRFKIAKWPMVLLAMILLISTSLWATVPVTQDQAPGRIMAQQATKSKKLWFTANHAQHEILKQDFKDGPEVTKACLACHNQASLQFHKTIHWTWMDPHTALDEKHGKGGLSVNNF
jgi:hypothetical protein